MNEFLLVVNSKVHNVCSGNAELMHTCSKNVMFVLVERFEYISDY